MNIIRTIVKEFIGMFIDDGALALFALAAVLLLAMNANPADAIHSMLQGAFGTENATAETFVKAIPILFVAIGICIAFRGGVINIGGEGQMIFGAIAGYTQRHGSVPTALP